MKNEMANTEMVVLMAIQQNSMGSAKGTKVVSCNNGGYDGDGTLRIALGLWRNNCNCVETVVKHWETRLSCSEHGNNSHGGI